MSRFVFTINNPTGLIDESSLPSVVTYLIYQEEVGESGTHHLQGYIETSTRMRYTTLINLLPDWDAGRWATARGTASKNRLYCSKEEGRVGGPYEFGEITVDTNQGERNDLADVRTAIEGGASDFQLFQDFPSVMARSRRFVSEYRTLWAESQLPVSEFIPREGWQCQLVEELKREVDPRKIIWIYDTVGNFGKSYFARNYEPDESFYVTGGKHSDIYFAYRSQRRVFFDVPRSAEDHFPYEVLEKFKDGVIFQAKYESRVLRFASPHVVVFANFPPNLAKLSADRWDVRNLVT